MDSGMESIEPTIRNAVRALIIRDDRVLLLRKGGDERGERYALPGGAQDPGETLQQALHRECKEEIDTETEILDLLHVADFYRQRPGPPATVRHQIEFLFSCSVPESYVPRNGSHPDGHQIEVIWTRLGELGDMPLLPRGIASWITNPETTGGRVYQGVIS